MIISKFWNQRKKIKIGNQLKNMSKKIPSKHGKYELKTRHNKIKHINQIHEINNHNILIDGIEKKKTEEWN